MAFQDDGGRGSANMVQGNWSCAKCGGKITSLPFEPDPSRVGDILCRDCHMEKRKSFRRSGSGDFRGGNRGPSKMFEGDWECAKCGTKITSLPFEPDPSRVGDILCRDCHAERRNSFRN